MLRYTSILTPSYSIENGRAIIPTIQELLKRSRALGFHVIHTREGHRSSLVDCPPVKHWRSLNSSSFGVQWAR
jgi:nicotinamidase-related amidase